MWIVIKKLIPLLHSIIQTKALNLFKRQRKHEEGEETLYVSAVD
jgi:hypothetical protein